MSAKRQVLFFGDGSEETQSVLKKVLLARTTESLLDRFLQGARRRLQVELERASQSDQHGLPKFHSLSEFVREDFDESRRHPALHPAEIVLAQIGQFIATHEKLPFEAYPDSNEEVIVGICFGELSATAVALARSLVELIPIAIEAVGIAFRCGLRSSVIGNAAERRLSPALPWSVVLPRDAGLSDLQRLQDTATEAGIADHKSLYVSARTLHATTIGGPPGSLERLVAHGDLKRFAQVKRDIRIYAPYHAAPYFSSEDAEDIIKRSESFLDKLQQVSWPAPRRGCIGCKTGVFYSAEEISTLFKTVVYNILAQPIEWEEVVRGCKAAIRATNELGVSAWHLRPFGQKNLAKLLASSLNDVKDLKIDLDIEFGAHASNRATSIRSPIAIVGMAGRFPGADNPDAFWEDLKIGNEHHREVPIDRFDPQTHLKTPAFGCFLENPGLFDPQFFNISPREALQTDPGQRMALVTAYEALENSGFVPNRTPSSCLGRVGTFCGQVADEYKEQNMAQDVQTYFIPGSMRAFAAGRINHYFQFGGPALNCDTACSSSCIALQMACNSIWSGECDTAVVGGMNICTSSDNFNGLSAGHFLSPTGGCKTWDKDADGYCRGEAVASVVIKSLDTAIADNDNILAVIKSIGTNYSAQADSITRPHPDDQERLYRQVLQDGGVQPMDIDYVEMHGTGTQVGDVAETVSITNALAPLNSVRSVDNPLFISALKPNIGHGESAAGISALIKVLLVLREQALPPHVGIKSSLNPKIPELQARNVQIAFKPTNLLSKREKGRSRHVLLNNFSAAGGNTACVLEEPPLRVGAETSNPQSHHAVTVSAKTVGSFIKNVDSIISFIERNPAASILDLSYTTTARRMHYPLRTGMMTTSVADLKDQLANIDPHNLRSKKAPKIAFCFTGQGAFYSGFVASLFQHSYGFRHDLTRYSKLTQQFGFADFLPSVINDSLPVGSLSPGQTQLGTTAVQMALVRYFRSLGVYPDISIGHSLGEYAALYASGMLSENDVLYLVGQRSRLMEKACTPGSFSMLVVQAGEDQLARLLSTELPSVEIVCLNSPKQSVLGGLTKQVELARGHLEEKGIRSHQLSVPFAFHSSQMDPIMGEFEERTFGVRFEASKIPMASPLLGSVLEKGQTLEPSYLRRHLRETNNFHGALLACQKHGYLDDNTVWIELGPHPLCIDMIRSTVRTEIPILSALHRNEDAWVAMLRCTTRLYSLGMHINWQAYHNNLDGQQLLSLPTYGWNEKNYWIPYTNDWLLNKGAQSVSQGREQHDGPNTTTLQRLVDYKIDKHKVSMAFETDLMEPQLHATITGHIINGSGLCPASVFADMAFTIGDYIRKRCTIEIPSTGMNVQSMKIMRPAVLAPKRTQEKKMIRIDVKGDLSTGHITVDFVIPSRSASNNQQIAECVIQFTDSMAWLDEWAASAYLLESRIDCLEKDLVSGSTNRFSRGMAYKLFSSFVGYNRKFQGMKEVLLNSAGLEATATLDLYQGSRDAESFWYNPYWIDSFLHLGGFVMNANEIFDDENIHFISEGWRSFKLTEKIDPQKQYKVYVKMFDKGGSIYSGNASIFCDGRIIALVEGLLFRKIPHSLLNALIPPPVPSDGARIMLDQPSNTKKHASSEKRAAGKQQMSKPNGINNAGSAFGEALEVLANEIGISVSEIGLDNSLQELGVDSLMSLAIASRLGLPPTNFRGDMRVSDLKKSLSTSSHDIESASERSRHPDTSSGRVSPVSAIETNATSPLNGNVDTQAVSLRYLIAECLGIDLDDLMAAERLSDLGMTSLTSLTVIEAAREQYGIDVPGSLLTQGCSMAELEDSLGLAAPPPKVNTRKKEEIPATSFEETRPAIGPQAITIPSVRAATEKQPPRQRQAETKALGRPSLDRQLSKPRVPISVLLQGGSGLKGPVLFMFPDGSGSTISYLGLSSLSSEIRIYGMNSPFLEKGSGVSFTIDEIVHIWANEIQNIQPSGPYLLGGWSAGGYYAYEVAQLLISAGKDVKKLVLIDTPPMNVYGAMPMELLDWLNRNNVMGGERATAAPGWLIEHFECTLTALSNYTPKPLQGKHLPSVHIIWATEPASSFTQQTADEPPLEEKVSYFLTQQRADFGPHGWEKLVRGCSLSIAKCNGSHFTMVLPPNELSLCNFISAAVLSDDDGAQGFVRFNKG